MIPSMLRTPESSETNTSWTLPSNAHLHYNMFLFAFNLTNEFWLLKYHISTQHSTVQQYFLNSRGLLGPSAQASIFCDSVASAVISYAKSWGQYFITKGYISF